MAIVLHIARKKDWERAKDRGIYAPETYEKEGFILCSGPAQLPSMADSLYSRERDLVLLCIVVGKVHPPVSWEPFGTRGDFPHIWGELNLDAVALAVDFVPGAEGKFELPLKVATYSG